MINSMQAFPNTKRAFFRTSENVDFINIFACFLRKTAFYLRKRDKRDLAAPSMCFEELVAFGKRAAGRGKELRWRRVQIVRAFIRLSCYSRKG
jgi:hypothetical protein